MAVVGLTASPATAAPNVEINLVAVNDFHGRINANTTTLGRPRSRPCRPTRPARPTRSWSEPVTSSVRRTFASAIDNDQPTIDVLNVLGLDVSAVGNHEFDKGWADLRDRVIGPDATRNAQWDYLASNVTVRATGATALDPFQTYVVDNGTPATPRTTSPSASSAE